MKYILSNSTTILKIASIADLTTLDYGTIYLDVRKHYITINKIQAKSIRELYEIIYWHEDSSKTGIEIVESSSASAWSNLSSYILD